MDPWLEQYWGDVHHSIITYARDQLQERLPPGLRARVDERLMVESGSGSRPILPDVAVIEQRGTPGTSGGGSGVAVAEPVVVRLPADPIRQGYIEIIDSRSGNRVVTAIEVLSPVNKAPGDGQQQYLRKQQEYRAARVSTVEIDLLRAGERVTLVGPEYLPRERRGSYLVCVRRGWEDATAELYPIKLRERLPVIKVPLRQTDADVTLDLQELIDRAYRNGGYDGIDYTSDARPPLQGEEATWADQLLRGKALRK
jgi:hypothetical protein